MAGMYRMETLGLESLKRSSYKTEESFELDPWGRYGLSPIARFFIIFHLLEECEEFQNQDGDLTTEWTDGDDA